ncbi:MAG TPA: S8 family serine peptidase, partial [Vicinamibacterales bacterium]|nr:S8 family serine peptidase [Vicinamibacterales bacterium]
MRLRLSIAVAAIAFVFTILPAHVKTQAPRDARRLDYVNGLPVADGEVLVRLRTGTAAERAAIDAIIDADDDHPIGIGVWRRVHSATRTVQLMLAALRGRGEILDVEPNYIVHVTDTLPNDPALPWGLRNPTTPGADIHATKAWDISTGSASIVVGVVDTGVDYTHPDLAGNMWTAPQQFTVTVAGKQVTCPAGSHGFNAIAFTANDTANICNPNDDNGHGTHTSGTIGAVGNNALGVVGVNWTTRIMGLKFLNSGGSGSTADAVNAIDFALQTKAAFASNGNQANVRVFSNSWGGGGASGSLSSAIDRAAAADVLFVAAAGNSGSNNDVVPAYPASYTQNNVVAVAATTETDGLAGFSNWGPTSVDLGAPGNNVWSTTPGGNYGFMSGTSMATPHVSGAAALLLSACSLNVTQLKAALLNNVDRIPSLNGFVLSNGRLNVDAAIRSCANVPTVTMTSPMEGASFVGPTSIPFAANASSSRGIAKVEFYSGSQLLGTSNTAPYGGTWTNVPAGVYTLTAKAYDTVGVASTSPPVHITVSNGLAPTNVALAKNGATALASSTYSSGYDASGAINGDRKGASWGSGGGWNDGTANAWPDWLEVDFAGAKTINEVDVFSVQDNYTAPV